MRRLPSLLLMLSVLASSTACKRREPPPKAYAPIEMPHVDHPNTIATEEVEPPRPIDREFWKWFTLHAVELANARPGSPIDGELRGLIHGVDPRLGYDVVARGGGHDFIVSGEGVKAAFSTVRRLVAAAPAIPGWRVIAFRPRDPSVTVVELPGGTRVDAQQITFEVLSSSYRGGTIDLAFFVPGITGSDLDGDMKVRHAMYLLLQHTLGEHDVETRLGGVLFEPAANASRDARPYRELRDVVDHWK